MPIEIEYNYNSDDHFAPPIRIQWMARNAKRLTETRWIFINCCGQIGLTNGKVVISSLPCKTLSGEVNCYCKVTKRHHAKQLTLLRTTHTQIVRYTPPLAQWSCCKKEIPAWNDAWSSRDRQIPWEYVDSGCLEGMYDSENETELDLHPSQHPTCLVAKPLSRKPKNTATSKGSHSSSGLQTVILERNKRLDPQTIKFTQNSVLKMFSDKTLPSILETAVRVLRGDLKIEDIPSIRVATRSNSESDDFYTADNRRLFLHRIVSSKESKVTWIQWSSEFDDKLIQNIRFDPQLRFYVSNDAIEECKNDCYKSLLIENGKMMDLGKIIFTSSSVLKQFSDERLPSILETAKMILRGEIKIEEIPFIKVASKTNSENDIFYSLDNRRLFLFKLLDIKSVKVQWLEWNFHFDQQFKNISKFDSKLHFNVTDSLDILDCRNELINDLFLEEISETMFHVPSECVGYIIGSKGNTIRRFCLLFGANIKIKSSLSCFLHSVSIFERKGSRNVFRPLAAKKKILKMVIKKYNTVS